MRRARLEKKVRWTALGAVALLAMFGCGGDSNKTGAGGGAAVGGASPGQGGRGGAAPLGTAGQGGSSLTGGGGAAGGISGGAGNGGTAAAAGSPDGSGGRGGRAGSAGGGSGGTAGQGATNGQGGAGVAGRGGAGTAGHGGAGTGGQGGAATAGRGGAGIAGHGGAGIAGSTGNGGAGGGVAVAVPQVTSLAPMEAAAGSAISLTVHGQGIASGWTIQFNGTALATTVSTAAGETVATASFTIATSVPTGQVPVWLASGSLTSNTVYFTVKPAAGAPTIVDYTPDNAVPGTMISIVGTNFASLPLTITDPLGRAVAIVASGTTTWVGAAVDRVDIVIPSDMPSGAFTATNSKGSFRGRIFNVGMNLVRLSGTVATASSQYNTTTWSTMSAFDNNLQTSWFSAPGDCATQPGCTNVPNFRITFATPQVVGRISIRGNREYASGYDFLSGRFEALGASGATIWSADRLLPDPDRDLDILISPPLSGVTGVRFTSAADESNEPGFSELEVFGP